MAASEVEYAYEKLKEQASTRLPLDLRIILELQSCVDAIIDDTGHGSITLDIVQSRFYGIEHSVSKRFSQEKKRSA